MRLACLAFVLGAWLLQQQASLPDSRALWIAFMLAIALALSVWLALRNSKYRRCGVFALCALALFTGFVWSASRADQRLADSLSPEREGEDLSVVGTVATLPYAFDRGIRFEFSVEQGPPGVPQHLALAWFSGWGNADTAVVPLLQAGERWRLRVRLKRPHGSANPWGFDYEYWLLEEGLRATGSVRVDGDNRRLAAFVPGFWVAIERLRGHLRDHMNAAFDGETAPYAAVLTALVVGDQRAITQGDWQTFNRTGVGHLISISGLHITMIAGLAAGLVFALWRRVGRLVLRIPAHKAAALAGVAAALFYCLIAGMGVPAQRTLYMLGVVAVALWSGRLTTPSRVLSVALALVVAIDPWAVMDAGFWLSFAAVASIFYVTTGRIVVPLPASAGRGERWQQSLVEAGRIQWAVTLGLVPLSMLLFQQLSLASPIANAVAIPVVSFVVTPLALLGAVLPGLLSFALLHAAHAVMSALAAGLMLLSGAPFAVWFVPAPSPWIFVAATVGVLWLLAPRGLPLRWMGWLWLAPLFAWPAQRPAEGEVWLTALDVGQGMAVLIETAHQITLYDTGPSYGPDSDGGSRIIVPYLRSRGIASLDHLIVSHNDNDHSGGALSVLHAVNVRQFSSSLAYSSPILAGTDNPVRCQAGQGWQDGGVEFALVHPAAESYQQENLKPNARSCVLQIRRVSASAASIALLAGDIEKPQERELLDRGSALHADVLLVPHHGSLTSSSEAFLDAVHPDWAVVQAGYRNRFGHPRPEVLARYSARGSTILRTDQDGALSLRLGESGWSVERYRAVHARYWYGR